MKIAQISLASLALLLGSAPAMSVTADALKLEVQAIGSQATLRTGTNQYTSPAGDILLPDGDSKSKAVSAPGAGLNMSYRLNEIARVGGGLAWINYDEGKDKPQYQDLSVHTNGTIELYQIDKFTLFSVAGLSYHMVDSKDQKIGLQKVEVDQAQLLNFDVGIGGEAKLSSNVNLALSYRFSDTLAKDSLKTKTSASNQIAEGKYKDVTLTQNEVLASVVYTF